MSKKGFIYYSIVTDRYQDMRIKKLKKHLGCAGIAVYDFILCEIYRVEGCFIVWDENTAFDVSDYFGLKETVIEEIVSYCCHVGLFNRELRDREGVLSSHSIQSRFIEWSRIAKRKNVIIPEKIKLLPEESAEVPEEPAIVTEEIDKVKKSKVKESKGEVNTPLPENQIPQLDLSNSNLYRQPRIPTMEEVQRVFMQNGGTLEMAKKFFEKNSAVGWFANNNPIVRFETMVPGYISSWRKNENNAKDQSSAKKLQGRIDYSGAL